jgi:hypothetical protein
MSEIQDEIPDVLGIVREWLEDHGYDGLMNSEQGCCCLIDNLNACSEVFADCEPGKKCAHDPGVECDYDKKEECQCEEEWDYQMYSKKEYDRLCAKEAVHRK